jgi:hypothetical protein
MVGMLPRFTGVVIWGKSGVAPTTIDGDYDTEYVFSVVDKRLEGHPGCSCSCTNFIASLALR